MRILLKYLKHIFTSRNSHGFGVHSPFVFNFVNYVIYEKNPFYIFEKIENRREALLKDKSWLNITDFGTGSNRKRQVKDIAKHSLKSKKYGQLMFRIIHYFGIKNILELGTSLGITTSYLASVSSEIQCISLEGCTETAIKAKESFDNLGIKNIKVFTGNIDNTLENIINSNDAFDLVFLDANHKSKALLSYFEICLSKSKQTSIFIVDDIYWSLDMEYAWNEIKNHKKVTSTIDLFHLGIVFFNPKLTKIHYKIYY